MGFDDWVRIKELNSHQATLAILLCRCARKLDSMGLLRMADYPDDPTVEMAPPEWQSGVWEATALQFIQQCHHGVLRTFSEESLQRLISILKKLNLLPSATTFEQATDILLRFQMNSFYISDELFTPVAAGVFTLGSLFNHSCVPNIAATFIEDRQIVVFRALRDIAPGEELVHSYVDLARCTRERRVLLKKDYNFDCACFYCTSPAHRQVPLKEALCQVQTLLREDSCRWELAELQSTGLDFVIPDECLARDLQGVFVVEPDLDGYEGEVINQFLQDELKRQCARIDQINSTSGGDAQRSLNAHLQSLAILTSKFHPLNLSIYSMQAEAYSIALELGQDDVALKLVQRLVLFQTFLYWHVPNHPLRTLQLFTYADLLLQAEDRVRAHAVYQLVLNGCKAIYGEDHSYTQLAKARLADSSCH